MPGSQGLKLNKSQKVYSPEILEANAIDARNINSAYPWLARLNYYADESGSKYWKKRVKDIYDLYGFDLGTPFSSVGGANNQLGDRTPPEDLKETNSIFVSKVDNKRINFKRLWTWTLEHFVDKINYKYEWVAGLLFFANQKLLEKEYIGKVTPTSEYGNQMRKWFEQVLNIECTDDQINEYRNGFFRDSNFIYSIWLNDLTGGPKQSELRGDQTIESFVNIKTRCQELENNFDINKIIDTP